MENLYVLLKDGDWEDMIFYIHQEEAIQASILYPKFRVEIFTKTNKGHFIPSYCYYKNGLFVEAQ